jgi:hypothetical protein
VNFVGYSSLPLSFVSPSLCKLSGRVCNVEKGEATKGYDPMQDIEWLQNEIQAYFSLSLSFSFPSSSFVSMYRLCTQMDFQQHVVEVGHRNTEAHCREAVRTERPAGAALRIRDQGVHRAGTVFCSGMHVPVLYMRLHLVCGDVSGVLPVC